MLISYAIGLKLMLSLFVIRALSIIVQKQIEQQVQSPEYVQNKRPVAFYVQHVQKLINIQFDDINFQISSQMFLHPGILGQDQIFDKNSYRWKGQQYCKLYPSNVETRQRSKVQFDDMQVVSYSVAHKSGEKKSRVYIVGSDYRLHIYSLDKSNIKHISNYSLPQSFKRQGQSKFSNHIQMIEHQGAVLVFNNETVFVLNQKNIIDRFSLKADGYHQAARLISVGNMQEDDQDGDQINKMFWVVNSDGLFIYQVNLQVEKNQFKLQQIAKYPQISQEAVMAVVYDQTDKYFYILSGNKLMIIRHGSSAQILSFPTSSQCQKISKMGNTLYLSCRYEKINYVQQIIITKGQDSSLGLRLNRYYDEGLVDGIRDVQPFDYNKVVLIGDEEAVVIGQAVNRNLLLQLSANNKQQLYQRFFSFGMLDIFYLSSYSTEEQSRTLLISEDSIKLFSLYYNGPSMECNISRQKVGRSSTLLVTFNTTQCPSNKRSKQSNQMEQFTEQKSQVCQTFYTFEILIGKKQYEQKTARLILVSILVLATTLMIVCIGCGVKIRNKANAVIRSIQNKIQKKKKEKSNKAFQKI